MADELAVQVAKAVVKELNAGSAAGSFAAKFTAKQSYASWDTPLKDDDLHVDVVILHDEITLETRGDWENTVTIDVVIRKQLGPENQEIGGENIAAINELVKLPGQIWRYFMPNQKTGQTGRRLSDYESAAWAEIDGENGTGPRRYLAEAMRKNRYVGWVRLAFVIPD